MPPPAGYTPLAASVAAKLNPFIARYSPELVSLWSKITERDANGEFIIDVNGFGIGSILDPMQRQEMALWGMIHEAVWRAELPMQTVAGGFNPWPGNKVGVPLVRTGKAGVGGPGGTVGAIEIPRRGLHERTRAVCFCLLVLSKRAWGRTRPKIAWRLATLAVAYRPRPGGVVDCERDRKLIVAHTRLTAGRAQFTPRAALALAEFIDCHYRVWDRFGQF
jgi:hypothetical protein